MSNHPRIPLRKGLSGESITNYANDEYLNIPQKPAVVQSNYNEPVGRVSGCEVFRRNINGNLDIDYAKHLIIDALHKYKDIGELTDTEYLILSIFLPDVFNFVDPAIAAKMRFSHFRLTPVEIATVNMAVWKHLSEEGNWNAGRGNGFSPISTRG